MRGGVLLSCLFCSHSFMSCELRWWQAHCFLGLCTYLVRGGSGRTSAGGGDGPAGAGRNGDTCILLKEEVVHTKCQSGLIDQPCFRALDNAPCPGRGCPSWALARQTVLRGRHNHYSSPAQRFQEVSNSPQALGSPAGLPGWWDGACVEQVRLSVAQSDCPDPTVPCLGQDISSPHSAGTHKQVNSNNC